MYTLNKTKARRFQKEKQQILVPCNAVVVAHIINCFETLKELRSTSIILLHLRSQVSFQFQCFK